MAKHKSKKSNKKGLGKVITALVMIVIMLAGCFVVGYGAGTDWTYKRGAVQAMQPGNTGDNSGGSDLTPDTEDNGIQVTTRMLDRSEYAVNGIAETVDSVFEIKVYVEPSIATNQQVEVSVEWLDPESDWADGEDINDYYSVTPKAAGSLTFNAVCKQSFGEPVIITFTSKDNNKAKKTVRADYVARLLDFSIDMYDLEFNRVDYHGSYFADWTVGTITCENFEITNLAYKFSEDFLDTIDEEWDYVSAYVDEDGSDIYYDVNYDYVNLDITYFESKEQCDEDCVGESIYIRSVYDTLMKVTGGTSEERQRLKDYTYYLINKRYGEKIVSGAIVWHIEYTYTLDGKTYNQTFEESGNFDCRYVRVPVIDLNADKTEIKH